MTRSHIILLGAIIAAAAVAALLLHRHAHDQFAENESELRQQADQLAGLQTEKQRLAELIAATKTAVAAAPDREPELAQLRAKVAALREQTSQLVLQQSKSRRSKGAEYYSASDFGLLDHNHELGISFRGGPRESGKMNDARVVAAALLDYAHEHQGDFPSDLAQAADQLPKPKADAQPWENSPLSGTNDFEIVYQGSQNDLTNIPLRRVALIRERQPWLTPDGKWARVYGYADGAVSTVQSDDNFQSWEARHILPPPANR